METELKNDERIFCIAIIMIFVVLAIFTNFTNAQADIVIPTVILISVFIDDTGKTHYFSWEKLDRGDPQIQLHNPGNVRIYYKDVSGKSIEETGFQYSKTCLILDGFKRSSYSCSNSMMITTLIPYVEGTHDITVNLEEDIVKKKTYLREFSPYKQFEMGIDSIHIVCKDGYELILRGSDEKPPKCVKPQTRDKLVERFWAVPVYFKELP